MSDVTRALCWAFGILFVALGNYAGVISDSSANTMFAILPVMAVLSLRGSLRCKLLRSKTA